MQDEYRLRAEKLYFVTENQTPGVEVFIPEKPDKK
jgi:hypothetical protein